MIVSHLRDEANAALIWAICAGIIKPNCIWAKVNERACKILLAAVFWFPHCKQLGSVPAGRHKAGGAHTCWEPWGAEGLALVSHPWEGDKRLTSHLLVKPVAHLC